MLCFSWITVIVHSVAACVSEKKSQFFFSSPNQVRVEAMVVEKTLSPIQISFIYKRRKSWKKMWCKCFLAARAAVTASEAVYLSHGAVVVVWVIDTEEEPPPPQMTQHSCTRKGYPGSILHHGCRGGGYLPPLAKTTQLNSKGSPI